MPANREELTRLVKLAVNDRSLRHVEQLTGVSRSTVQRLLEGGATSARTLENLAEGLKVDSVPMLEAAGLVSSRRVPAVVPLPEYQIEIDAGPLLLALGDVRLIGASVSRVTHGDSEGGDGRPIGPIRAWRIVGDCMAPVLVDGDEILTLPAESVKDGDTVTATVDLTQVTCKRIRIDGTKSWLEPLNGEARIEEGRFVVTGVVFRVVRDPARMFPKKGIA